MNERVHEADNPVFELPLQPEGWEGKQEKAIEGQLGQDSQSLSNPAHILPATPSAQSVLTPTNQPSNRPADDDNSTDDKTSSQDLKKSDVIERHWVDLVKEVITRTKDNPFAQKKQMSLVKADYLKTEFNKLIKTEETG